MDREGGLSRAGRSQLSVWEWFIAIGLALLTASVLALLGIYFLLG